MPKYTILLTSFIIKIRNLILIDNILISKKVIYFS